MSLFHQEVPQAHPARSLELVQRLISRNVEAQDEALRSGQPALVAELQREQRALFTERRYAEWARTGTRPEIVRER